MGYSSSIILVKNALPHLPDEAMLEKLGFNGYRFSGEITFEEVEYPCDGSVNIGYKDNCLIICEDYQLSGKLEMTKDPSRCETYEKILCGLFPGAEVLSLACHSGTNYQMYSLAVDGTKLRFKRCSSDEEVVGYGKLLPEEEPLYNSSRIKDGKCYFPGYNGSYEWEENQLMEDFIAAVAQRHLGVHMFEEDGEELMDIPMKKYLPEVSPVTKEGPEKSRERKSWFKRLLGG